MNFFKTHWKEAQTKKEHPHHIRNIILIEAEEFVDRVTNADEEESKSIVESVYSGDAYILKNAFNKEEVEDIKSEVFEWSKSKPSESFQMLDDCPNYHCINDKPKGPSGGYTTIEHSYVFFRHNSDSLTSRLFESFDRYWGAIKVLSGYEKDSFTKNIPSDGIIDRITFLQYPYNCGKISKHYDSSKIQKLLLGGLFSQIGEDYEYGENGFYVTDRSNKKIFLENIASKGDFLCVSPTLYHGVPNVTKNNKQPNWDSLEGRWYLQCYSPESHEVTEREFTVGIGDSK